MALTYAGIDEAGYGPLLGPLCIGMAVFEVDEWSPGQPPPNLWRSLASAVSEAPSPGRIAIADSKKLKGHSKTRHPLLHLERGVLGGLATIGDVPPDDGVLFQRLGAELEPRPWYAEPHPLPCALTRAAVGIDANVLRNAMTASGVRIIDLRCIVVGETQFNDIVDRAGSKAEATIWAISRHLRAVRDQRSGREVRVVCDRLGGRTSYAGVLREALGIDEVGIVEQSERVSRYDAAGLGVLFQPEAETAHLPVALASMTAKYCRELLMARFNRYWCARMPELKPTAGYTTDARRWLVDAAPVLTAEDRQAMIRKA